MTASAPAGSVPKYHQLADHCRGAIQAGSLLPGQRMPSLRALMAQHMVSLTTAMQACRLLESEGWLEARPRSGYFVRQPSLGLLAPVNDPPMHRAPDAAQYVGIHAKVSQFLSLGRLQRFKTNLSVARCAPELYPADALQQAALRMQGLPPVDATGAPITAPAAGAEATPAVQAGQPQPSTPIMSNTPRPSYKLSLPAAR